MRSRKEFFYLWILLIPLIISLFGCSANLSKDKAREILSAAKKYPVKKIGTVKINHMPGKGMIIGKKDMPSYIKMLTSNLILLNVIDLNHSGIELYDVKMTDEGKKYILTKNVVKDKIVFEVLLGELIFDKIISIRKPSNENTYYVHYSEEISRLSPFGACLIDTPVYEATSQLTFAGGKWMVK
jgi:hypothetical protein